MSNVEKGDVNAQKLAQTLEEYERIASEALEKNEAEFLEYVAGTENYHEIDRLYGALSQKIVKYKTNTPERIKISRLLSLASARRKELKPKSMKGFGDRVYRNFKGTPKAKK